MPEERKFMCKKQPTDIRDRFFAPKVTARCLLPPKVDLREEMSPALDQGEIGSCTANAASNCLRHLLKKQNLPEFQPSRLFIYYNSRVLIEGVDPCEDSGATLRDVCKALSKYHACCEEVWQYLIYKYAEKPCDEAYENADLHQQLLYHAIRQDLQVIKLILNEHLPIMVGIQIFDSIYTEEVSNSGTLQMPNFDKDKLLGGHAVIIVGYDDETRRFTIMNSWGSTWGDNGYFTIPYEYILNPNLASDFWVLKYFA